MVGRMRLAQEPLAWHPSTASPPESPAPSLPSGITQRGSSSIRRHGQPRIHRHRDHAGSAAEGLCLRHLSDGGERRGSGALLDRAGDARHHPARRLSSARHGLPARCAPTASPSPSTATSTACSTAAPRRCRAGRAPGSTRASARSTASCTSAGIATASKSTTATELVGGLYGVTLGRAFFGESMFHRARDASKVALVHLMARLRAGGFKLLRHAIRHRTSQELRRDRSAEAAISPAAGSGAHRRSRFHRAANRPSGDRARKRWRCWPT